MKSPLIAWGACIVVACAEPERASTDGARIDTARLRGDTTPELIESRVPSARAGEPGWMYAQRVIADLDGDGANETAVLISDVGLDTRGRAMWEHGHRWQVYVEERDGEMTRAYARFLPNGKLTAELVVADSGSAPTIVLLEQTPHHIGVYEVRYRGPGRAEVRKHLDRMTDATRTFLGSPRP